MTFPDGHPLVRKISLPGIITRTTAFQGRVRPVKAVVPPRKKAGTYPKIGIIDGGLGSVLSDWVIDRWGLLAEEHKNLAHGSFIGGLAVLGRTLNGSRCCPESNGAELVDLDVFPSEGTDAFASYYPQGLPGFFDEVETAIGEMRARNGVRIFNMSLNIIQQAALDRYSPHAARLDRIAEENDAIIFVSAGNLDPRSLRPEWSEDTTKALADVAASINDGLLSPAESVRNVSVAAVNPPGHLDLCAFCAMPLQPAGAGFANRRETGHRSRRRIRFSAASS